MKNFLSQKWSQVFFICLIFAIFFIFLFLNKKTPIWSDDWAFFVAYQNNRVNSWRDVFSSVNYFYSTVNGRVFANFLVMVFTKVGKDIFNILNALMFVSLGLLIHYYSKNDKKKDLYLIIAIFILLWSQIPSPNQTFFWMCGAIIYLWMMVFDLLFMFPFFQLTLKNKNLFTKKKISCFLMFFAGIFAGNSHELLAPFILLISGLVIFFRYRRGHKIFNWQIASMVGIVIGFIVQFLAPGNFTKLSSTSSGQIFSNVNFEHLAAIFNRQIFLWEAVVIIFVLFFINHLLVKKSIRIIDHYMLVLLIMAIVLNVMGLFFPYFPPRASFFSSIFLIMFISRFLAFENMLFVKRSADIICIPFFLISLNSTIQNASILSEKYQQREESIIRQIKSGSNNIVVEKIKIIKDPKLLNDPLLNSDDHNSWASKYYQVKSIDLK